MITNILFFLTCFKWRRKTQLDTLSSFLQLPPGEIWRRYQYRRLVTVLN